MSTSSSVTFAFSAPLAEVLSSFELFKGLTSAQLQWFVEHASDEQYEEGAHLVKPGDLAEHMNIIVDGQLRFQSTDPNSPVLIARAGQATGMLPFSRLRQYVGNAYAIERLRVSRLHRDLFPEMLQRIPELGPRLVAVMSDRIRDNTRLTEQREKLLALGKRAAGLAHELNNPASAAQRAANDLRRSVNLLRDSNQSLAECGFDAAQFQCLLETERSMIYHASQAPDLDTLARGDKEEELGGWLNKHGVPNAWEIAPVFVDVGVDSSTLEEVAACYPDASRNAAFSRLAAALAIERLTTGIQTSTQQMTDLVRAVKEYAFVDQAPQQDVDIESGLENTLSILSHRLRHGIAVIRQYDGSLPRIPAYGSELNQVWTHLIDNAIDAMDEGGTLRLRTASEAGLALVEVIDSGKGIPAENRDRIFDPFFTTKDVGAGRGLGLDVAFRIVQKHRGDIRFTSRPGETCFQVRLPLHSPGAF
jgi:signal transduction histidine kinase